MKRLLIAMTAAAGLLAAAEAEAAVTSYRSNYRSSARAAQTYNNGNYYRTGASRRADGPFARMMDLERRKNAALRQMFFGY